MKRSSSLVFAIALTALIATLLLSTLAVAQTPTGVVYGPAQISTGGDEETPQIVVDSQGNAHIVWSSLDGTYLLYKMVDPNGVVLIEETNLLPSDDPVTRHVRRPSLAIDSADHLHIVYHGFSRYTGYEPPWHYNTTIPLRVSEVLYLKINPSLDDQDGSSSTFDTLTVLPEQIISTDDGNKSRAPNLAIDPFDHLHVTWWDGDTWNNEGEIHYLVLDTDGAVVTSEATVVSGIFVDIDWGEPEIAADANSDAHIVYCRHWDNDWDDREYDREIYYLLIDGATGVPLINDTCITTIDGNASVNPVLAVASPTQVHVVWHDRRFYNLGIGEHELFYLQLNPSLDDQSGDAADPATITVVPEQLLTPNDGYRSYLKNLVVAPNGDVLITWIDMAGYDPSDDEWGKGEVYLLALESGGVIKFLTRVTYFNGAVNPAEWTYSSNRSPDLAVTSDRVFITFNGVLPTDGDGEDGEISDIYLVILGPEPVGGEILPVNALALLAPYLLLLTAAAAIVGVFARAKRP